MNTADPTLVILVRHGETPTTGRLLPGRAPGLHLSERGREQAAAVAERLRSLAIDALYTSPLERTRETAEPTVTLTGLTPAVEDGLLECEVGEWTGETLADLSRLPAWDDVQHRPSAFRFPGGESFVEMQERMVATVDTLRARHAGGTIVCFSHADPIRCLLAHALGTRLDDFQRISVGPCSVSALSYPASTAGAGASAPVVLTVNSTSSSLAELAPS